MCDPCVARGLYSLDPSLSLSLSTERYVERALLLRRLQGDEPHAVYRLRSPGPRESVGYLADDAQHDRRGNVLRRVHRSRHRAHPVAGLVSSTVPREGTNPTSPSSFTRAGDGRVAEGPQTRSTGRVY